MNRLVGMMNDRDWDGRTSNDLLGDAADEQGTMPERSCRPVAIMEQPRRSAAEINMSATGPTPTPSPTVTLAVIPAARARSAALVSRVAVLASAA